MKNTLNINLLKVTIFFITRKQFEKWQGECDGDYNGAAGCHHSLEGAAGRGSGLGILLINFFCLSYFIYCCD